MIDEYPDNLEPDSTEPDDLEPDNTEPEFNEHEETETVEDEQYQLESVPDTSKDYAVAGEQQAEDFDDVLLSSFCEVSFGEKLTQTQFSRTVEWWNQTGQPLYVESGFNNDEIKNAFLEFAKENSFTEKAADSLILWFNDYVKKSRKEIEQIKNFARKSGNKTNDSKAAQIAQVRNSKAYRNKGLTKNERDAHKAAVKKMFELTGAIQ